MVGTPKSACNRVALLALTKLEVRSGPVFLAAAVQNIKRLVRFSNSAHKANALGSLIFR